MRWHTGFYLYWRIVTKQALSLWGPYQHLRRDDHNPKKTLDSSCLRNALSQKKQITGLHQLCIEQHLQ